MNITPLDIRKHTFKKAGRGFDAEEVSHFLEMVAAEYEALIRENSHLKEKLADLDRQIADYRQMEKTLRDTLVSAQMTAEETKRQAVKEAELILKDAELNAEQLQADAKQQVKTLKLEIERLKKHKETFLIKQRALLESHLKMLSIEESSPSPDH
ncbi:MAG: DivIVA domain-containing protein [Gemmatimonadetes bacterium]|nr:MAG: DivIVA domain-containing protein [Gemmatimonadota bacterium]